MENNAPPAEQIQAMQGKNWAFVYSAAGWTFTMNMGKIAGETVKTAWFKSCISETKDNSSVRNAGQQKFIP